jgi:predicted nucleotide-binding protein (sugar kinase/HSP70/actin superfamily)
LDQLGIETVVPEKPNLRTLQKGALHSPEFVCLPFKVTLGDCMNALEKGADTLAMVCGMWACRFGYYGRVQHLILRDIGHEFDSILIGREEPGEIWRKLRPEIGKNLTRKVAGAFALFRSKASAVDLIEAMARKTRPRELERGSSDGLLERYLGDLDRASSQRRVWELRREARQAFDSLPMHNGNDIIRLRIVGELYVLLEPTLNLDLVRRLESSMGVEAQPVLSTYRWLISPLWLDPSLHIYSSRARRVTRAYLPYVLGGEEHMTIAGVLSAREDGFDGVIHAYPLTCMPENICRTILPDICSRIDLPLLSLCFDEHTSAAGLNVRLEAFVDMLRVRKKKGIRQGSIRAPA